MKIFSGCIALVLALAMNWTRAEAVTMADLFAALKEHPVTELDALQTRSSELNRQAVHDRFYPQINGVLSYEKYNSPTNWRPVLPTESAQLLARDEPLPFSETISRAGVTLSFPVFVKELFSMGKQAEMLARSARAKKRLKLLEHQAMLLSADARLLHLASLEKSLEARKASLEKTRQDVILQVENGRIPETERIRMDEAINQIKLSFNETISQELVLKKTIESLTSIYLDEPVPLQLNSSIQEGELFALEPIREAVKAKELGVQVAKDKLYPRIVGTARWFHNYGEGYNTGEDVDDEYGSFALTLQIPLFNKPAYTEVEKAKIAMRREKAQLARTAVDLEAKARSLHGTLSLLQSSRKLAAKSVDHERRLLEVAKIAYASRRMSQEEYLRYEEKILSAEAKYYLIEARWWEVFSSLAVLYGNSLEQLVK